MDMDMSASWLVTSSLIGMVGFVLFVYGKKQARLPQLVTGMTLMIFPYFVTGAWAMVGISALILGGMQLALRSGM